MSEYAEQKALFDWVALAQSHASILKRIYAIPNGGLRPYTIRENKHGKKYRYSKESVKLKRTGTKPGVWDIHIPVPIYPFAGAYIEMKWGNGKLTSQQIDFRIELGECYKWYICYSWIEAKDCICQYLDIKINHPLFK